MNKSDVARSLNLERPASILKTQKNETLRTEPLFYFVIVCVCWFMMVYVGVVWGCL